MAAVMLLGVLSVGMIGLAADFNLNAQYSMLADALKNEYVADLTNYTLTNPTLNNGADGFDTDANGFAYEHRVTAKDNSNGDILKAANRFYCILENIMSTKYGEGLYDPGMIHSTVTARLKTYFDGADETYYEDFYGKRYYPTEEEIKNYNDTVSLLEAADREITPAVLTGFRIYFMEKDYYSFFNVDTIIQYFLGNTLKINAGNWYHRYLFIVETSLDTWLTEAGDINNLSEDTINVRKAVYELDYDRTFNETQTKAFYAFRQPELETVWQHYADEFGFDNASSDLTATVTKGGQAAAFMIKAEADQTTIPYLRNMYLCFQPYIEASVDNEGNTWDYQFSKLNETELAAKEHAADIVRYMDELGSTYSNDALMSMFGKKIGNMISLAEASYGISSKSPYKDVAWEFLRSFFTKEYQQENYNLSSRIDVFEQKAEEATTIQYQKDGDGKFLLDEDGEKIPIVRFYMNDGKEVYNLEPEQVQQIRDLIESTTKVADYNQEILDIVSEQAAPFFAGQKSAEEVARLVQSKGNIYVNEQR